jgi:predicted nucleic acid-binding protein
LIDSGFWFALLDERDPYFPQAQAKADVLRNVSYILPWPVLYETMCTRFVRRPDKILQFETFLKRPHAVIMDDTPYRSDSLDRVFSEARRGFRAISLVDTVVRLILDDVNVMKHGLITFNPRDFADVCARRRVPMI